jgi:hypothetical protein
MKTFTLGLSAVALFIGITGCSNKSYEPIEPKAYHHELENAPKWILNPDINGTLAASGSARISQMGMQFAIDEAENAARVSVARRMEVKVSAMNETFNRITGTAETSASDSVRSETSRTLSHQSLVGLQRTDVWISPSGEVWVRMALRPESLSSLKEGLHSTYKSASAKYQHEQAKEALKTMDEQIEKIDKE